ncbi:MAG: hypothetical protein VSS75_002720 [Candidatus Parabeggiatoa sp.]|nr:hypothetical protein [Candidatus Parabeggiatoa sp.]
MKILNWFLDHLVFVLLLGLSVVAVLFSLGVITSETIPIATLTLSLLFTIGLYLLRMGAKVHSLSQTVPSIKAIKEKVDEMTAAKVLSGREACFHQLNCVIKDNSRIDATYFSKPPLPETQQLPNERQYWANLEKYLKTGNDFHVRRIVTVENSENLEWVTGMLEKLNESPGFSLVVLNTMQPFPYMNIIVVDSQYTMIFPPHPETTDGPYLFIDDKPIARDFGNNVFGQLWGEAERTMPLKMGRDIFRDNFQKLEERVAGR